MTKFQVLNKTRINLGHLGNDTKSNRYFPLIFQFQNQVSVLNNNNNNGNINNNNSQDEPRRKKHEVARPNHILLFTILNPLYPITVVSTTFSILYKHDIIIQLNKHVVSVVLPSSLSIS